MDLTWRTLPIYLDSASFEEFRGPLTVTILAPSQERPIDVIPLRAVAIRNDRFPNMAVPLEHIQSLIILIDSRNIIYTSVVICGVGPLTYYTSATGKRGRFVIGLSDFLVKIPGSLLGLLRVTFHEEQEMVELLSSLSLLL